MVALAGSVPSAAQRSWVPPADFFETFGWMRFPRLSSSLFSDLQFLNTPPFPSV
jgi:hypothetical protein